MPENLLSENGAGVSEGFGATSPFAAGWATATQHAGHAPHAPGEAGEEHQTRHAAATPGASPLSPFTLVSSGPTAAGGPVGEMHELLGEAYESLHDEAFGEALTDIVNEAGELAAQMPEYESEDSSARLERARQMLYEHVEPVISAAERFTDNLADELENRDLAQLPASEIDRLAAKYAPPGIGTAPLFEGLFGFIKKAVHAVGHVAKKVGGAVVGAAKAVGKFAIKPLLNKLKGLLRPFVQMLMTSALNRLPKKWQKKAKRIAKPVMHALGLHEAEAGEAGEAYVPGGAYELTGDAGEADEADEAGARDASEPAAELERDLRAHAAGVICAPDDATRDALVSAYKNRAAHAETGGLNELDEARERFAGRLARLGPDESVQPAMEEFIPVVLAAARPFIKKGIEMAGREHVVNFLTGLLTPLLSKFLKGPEAKELSTILVNLGLGLLAGEAAAEPGETGMRPVAEALAHTVQDTVAHLGELAPEAFADEAVLEAETMEAFTRAAGTYLPPRVFKPAMRRTHRLTGVFLPAPGAPFARYSDTPEIVIPWQVAHSIVTYGGERLSQYLRNRYGVQPGEPVRARVYIWRLGLGGRLGDIASRERHVPGFGRASRTAIERLHPLTRVAALSLLGEPELGEDLPDRYLASRGTAMLGERVYALRPTGTGTEAPADPVPQATPAPIAPRPEDPDRPGRPALAASHDPGARGSNVRVTVDRPHHEVRLRVFLSEPRAQEIAKLLRRGGRDAVTGAVEQVRQAAADAVGTMHDHGPLGRVRIRHEGFDESVDESGEEAVTEGLIRMRRPHAAHGAHGAHPHGRHGPGAHGHTPHQLTRHVVGAAMRRIAELFRTRAAEFTAATQDQKNGVTLVVVFDRPPFLQGHGQAKGHAPALGDHVEVRVLPGHAEG